VRQQSAIEELGDDGLNATRALVLQAYYALRRRQLPSSIGAREIAAWIETHEKEEAIPSPSLIQLTLARADVPHRRPGRPRLSAPISAPPLCRRRGKFKIVLRAK
jgi:hypothetical protein